MYARKDNFSSHPFQAKHARSEPESCALPWQDESSVSLQSQLCLRPFRSQRRSTAALHGSRINFDRSKQAWQAGSTLLTWLYARLANSSSSCSLYTFTNKSEC